jgi:hypothetical protein
LVCGIGGQKKLPTLPGSWGVDNEVFEELGFRFDSVVNQFNLKY